MKAPISRPLYALLLLAVVTSIIVTLKPAADVTSAADDLLPERRPYGIRADVPAAGDINFSRRTVAPPDLRNQGYSPPPPPPPPVVVVVPPKPTAPNPPFTYLGQMVRDGREVVFLGQGDTVEAVSVGDDVGDSWRLEGVSEAGLQLRYVPLNEVRTLLTSK